MADDDADLVARLGADPGLCARCSHRRLLASRRSAFLRCDLADVDPRFRRYPSLPVLACTGFAAERAGGSRVEEE